KALRSPRLRRRSARIKPLACDWLSSQSAIPGTTMGRWWNICGRMALCPRPAEHNSGHHRLRGGLFARLFPRQTGRVLVSTLAEARFHADRQRDGALAIFLAQAIGRGQRLVPLFMRALAVEADLLAFRFEMRGMHAEQADGITLPIFSEELTDG